jgi:hypothetical protein
MNVFFFVYVPYVPPNKQRGLLLYLLILVVLGEKYKS